MQAHTWISVVLVVVGLIGNSLTMWVSQAMRRSSSTIYLFALSASDSAFLIFFVAVQTLTNLRCLYAPSASFDIYNRSDVSCGLLQYLLDLFSDWSAVLILIFTVDRYIACYHSIRYSDLCTHRRAILACGASLAGIAAVIAPYHAVGVSLYREGGSVFAYCIISQEYRDLFALAYTAELVLFRMVPIIAIAVLNVLIMIKVRKFHRDRAQRRNNTARNFEMETLCSDKSPAAATSSTRTRNAEQSDSQVKLSVMLMVVSTTYIVLYLPVLIHYFVRATLLTEFTVASAITQYITETLDVAAFAVNFFLYTLSGTEFRKHLRKLLRIDDVRGACANGRCETVRATRNTEAETRISRKAQEDQTVETKA